MLSYVKQEMRVKTFKIRKRMCSELSDVINICLDKIFSIIKYRQELLKIYIGIKQIVFNVL